MAKYDLQQKREAKKLALQAKKYRIKQPEYPSRVSGQIEKDDSEELNHLREQLKKADQNAVEVSGEEYSVTLIFLSKTQRDAFLQKAQWHGIEGGRYVDGLQIADKMGIELPVSRPTAIRPGKTDKKAIAMGIEIIGEKND